MLRLGLNIQTLTPDVADQLGYQNDSGIIVTSVASGSPAGEAGLQRGDLIKEVNRKEVRTVQDFEKEINERNTSNFASGFQVNQVPLNH